MGDLEQPVQDITNLLYLARFHARSQECTAEERNKLLYALKEFVGIEVFTARAVAHLTRLLNIPLRKLGLPDPIRDRLQAAGIKHLSNLVEKSEAQLRDQCDLSELDITVIKLMIEETDHYRLLQLGMEIPTNIKPFLIQSS